MRDFGLKLHATSSADFKWVVFIGVLIVLISMLHYATTVHLPQYHELYRVFYYLPIILAAFRFQLAGGVISAVAIIVLYLPHVVFQWGGDLLYNFSRFLQMLMYLVIGMVAGVLSRREYQERQRYQTAAQELEQSYQKLKQQSEQLAEIQEQLRLSERLSVLGELSASMAHEIRNPLAAIWGAVEILQDQYQKIGQNPEFLDILMQEIKRLNKVVDHYLALAQKPQIVPQSCDLYQITESVLFLLRNRAYKHNIALVNELIDRHFTVIADENQLRQVLINLVLNSIAAIGENGTITIKAENMPPGIGIKTGRDLPAVSLSIIDTGQGIKPEHMDRIFEPFFTTRANGTGLGLSIVKRIVEQNRWRIEIHSKPGHGTEITLIFPSEAAHG